MEKGTGILMPLSALPNDYGIGSLGCGARDFVDVLAKANQKYWQVLPLVPTGYGDSPYQSCGSFAFSPYYIDLEVLRDKGLLTEQELSECKCESVRVDYEKLFNERYKVLKKAFKRFDAGQKAFLDFVAEYPELSDFALYMAVKEQNNYTPWYEWKKELRIPTADTLLKLKEQFASEINFWLFTQFEFILQYIKLIEYADKKGVKIIGDIPIYVALDSADVWLNPQMFLLDKTRKPKLVAGVPPDYFSADGQLWGNPLYNYKYMQADNFAWWHRRIEYSLKFFSALRIDHFRGFDRFFTIPASEKTAKNGKWKKAPGFEIFKDILSYPIIAEDLGILDDGVYRLLKRTKFPGMKVLSFAFDSNPENLYKPSNFKNSNCIAYSGTHDNEPLFVLTQRELKNNRGRFVGEVNSELKKAGFEVLDTAKTDAKQVADAILKLLFSSKANIRIAPVGDVLSLGSEARLNFPSTISLDNWSWRMTKNQQDSLAVELEKFI